VDRHLRNEYNRFMNWRRGQRTRMKNDPTVDLPPPTTAPVSPPRTTAPVPPQSSIDSSFFEPQKTPMSALASLPVPQAAPKQGGIASYMPPSMRQPGSALAMAAQQRQQPVAMADGGYVDISSRVDKAMAWRQKTDNKITVGKGRR